MTAEQLEKLQRDGVVPIILDVRSGFEYQAGHIPGAVHAPLNALGASVGQVVQDKNRHIVLVCEHGPRAQMAKLFLKIKGFKNLELLEGHMSLWRRTGRPVQPG